MTETIANFGLHCAEGGIWFLEQGVSTNALGINLTSPFKHPRPKKCNHNVRIVREARDYEIPDDDLIRELLPIPKHEDYVPYFVGNHNHVKLVAQLVRMTSPINMNDVIRPVWSKTALHELHSSNIQPLVITSVKLEHSSLVKKLAEASISCPRKLVFIGEDTIAPYPPIKKFQLSASMTLPDYDWEDFGGWFIGRWMLDAKAISSTGCSVRD